VLAADAAEERVEGGEQHRERRGVEGPGHRGDPLPARHRHDEALDPAGRGLHGRAGAVGGQGEHGRSAVEQPAPVRHRVGVPALGQPGALPGGVVRVLDGRRITGRRITGIGLAAQPGGVPGGQFPQHDLHRPPVADQVVGGEHDPVAAVADRIEGAAQQRAVLEVERVGRRGDHGGVHVGRRRLPLDPHRGGPPLRDHLAVLAVGDPEDGTQ
jgi:hypothetical protein